jgi:hypothetical protein
MPPWTTTLGFTFLVLLPAALVYHKLLRPWHLCWGTIADEASRRLPADDIVRQSHPPATRAITIRDASSAIWPWLVQMGQGRGGFYSYSWLENLTGAGIRNATRIVPEWQRLKVGDAIPLHPRLPPLRVAEMVPNQLLVLQFSSQTGGSADERPSQQILWTWTFVLQGQNEDETRLLVRTRSCWGQRWPGTLCYYLLLEPGHFVMERRMLRTIRQRVESCRNSAGGEPQVG